MTLIPKDFTNPTDLLPINVNADGDFLPHSGSLLTYDTQTHNNEIRARLAIELAIHKNLYLDEAHLQKGITIYSPKQRRSLPTTYAIYSDLYTWY